MNCKVWSGKHRESRWVGSKVLAAAAFLSYRGRIFSDRRFGFGYGDQWMRQQQNGCNHRNHDSDPQVQQKCN